MITFGGIRSVSYTHLDVYKRQLYVCVCNIALHKGYFHILVLEGESQRPVSEHQVTYSSDRV